MPQPLPENPHTPGSLQFHAYERCLELERSADNANHEGSSPRFSPQMCGRILGYMMLEAPSSIGCENVRKEIERCQAEEDLRNLARFYAEFFIRLFRKAKGPTPGSSSHRSRPSFDDTQQTIKSLMEQAPKNHKAVKQLALKRDNYRCVVTGAYDGATFQKQLETDPAFEPPTTPRFTQVAHIFPDSLNQDLVGSDGLPSKKLPHGQLWNDLAKLT
ncbi:hypothetical protein M407DRAFT_26133 [Tulasnella calospora MUT 4182]|uniref:HNH nuclease domain-containing protein n=1 Tax=Tulasnella calospora MUT 4182 TaxID=1051891 RepID=A0A0C3LST6_9AGAM|nr:hypothetical protein M407DRAFT_26133 [Tulasnella calospora MUT 4182]